MQVVLLSLDLERFPSIDIIHFHYFSFSFLRYCLFAHLMIGKNAIKSFPLIVKVKIEPLRSRLDIITRYPHFFQGI